MTEPARSTARQYTDYRGEQESWLNREHTAISGKFAKDKGLWDGRRVAVKYLHQRGNRRVATDMRVAYGVLVLDPGNGRTDQIAVRDSEGALKIIHVNRAKRVWDLTRAKAGSR